MATINITRTYQDGEVLVEQDLHNIADDVETFLNTTKINDDNIQNSGINGATKLLNASVSETKLAANSVSTAKLVDGSVTTAKILDANITTAKVNDAAITTVKVADLNITTGKLADNAVTTVKVTDLNITTAKLADLAVTTAKIADSAVTTEKINDGAISRSKIAAAHTITTLNETITTGSLGSSTFTTTRNINTITDSNKPRLIKLIDGSVEIRGQNTALDTTVRVKLQRVQGPTIVDVATVFDGLKPGGTTSTITLRAPYNYNFSATPRITFEFYESAAVTGTWQYRFEIYTDTQPAFNSNESGVVFSNAKFLIEEI